MALEIVFFFKRFHKQLDLLAGFAVKVKLHPMNFPM